LWTTATPFVSNTGNQDDPSAIHFIDLDGNGSTEILLAEDGYSSISNEPRRGGVFAVDAGSGSQLWLAEGSGTYHSFGSDLRFFDANSDGTLDCMNADRKAVELVDGQTGSNVWVMNTFQFMDSSQASVLEDLTGDGVPDYVGINDTSSDTLFAIDGQSGSLLWRIDGDAAIGSYVRNVQAVNVDGLGTTEIVFTSPVGAGGRGFVTAVDGPSGQPLWTVVGSHRQFGFGYDTHIHATGPGNPVQVITKDFMPFRNELISVDGATGSVMWRKALPASLDGYWISADLNGDGTNEIIEIDEQLDLGIAIFDPATGAILKSVQNFLGDAFKWGGFHDDLDGDGWMDLLFLGGRYYPNTPKVISSKQDDYASCLNLSSNNISQANGGSISVGLEFPLEFANSSYRLLLSTKQGVESYGGALVPLMPSMLFNRTKMGDYLGLSFTGAIGNLSLMADGTIIWRVAPNELPVAAVGQTFSMAVVLEITNGNFGLFSSGHKAITITP